MYGVESCVHPAYQGQGVGSLLMNARFDVLKRLNLKGMIAGSMIMGYGAVADHMTPEQYVQDVIDGSRFDNNLSKQMKKGFRVLNVIPNYVFDPRTLNYAAAMVWENPAYDAVLGVQPTSILPVKRSAPARADHTSRPANPRRFLLGATGS